MGFTIRRIAMLAVVLAIISAAALSANRGFETEITYWSDSSKTVIVGEGYVDCNWQFHMIWGDQSAVYDTLDNTQCGGAGGGWSPCPSGCASGLVCCYAAGGCAPYC
jgi:hypothetical protein